MDERLEPQASAPADRELVNLSTVVEGDPGEPGPRPLQPPAGSWPAVPRRCRDRSRHRAGGQRPARAQDRRPQRHSRRRRRSCSSRRPATVPRSGTRRPGPDRYRRALYTFRYRSVPYPMLQTFDAPNGDFACVRRTRSNTPLQALTTLNEPIFLECARALALRTLRQDCAHRRRPPGLRLPTMPVAQADRARGRDAPRPAAPPDPALRKPRRRSLVSGRRRPEEADPASAGHHAVAARRLDRGGAGHLESG